MNTFLWIFSALVVLAAILFYFIAKNKKRDVTITTDLEKKEVSRPLQRFITVIQEFEFNVKGTQDNAQRTSRNRQMLLLDMGSYDEVILQQDRDKFNGEIVVLNEQGYDLGYLGDDDKMKISPYMNKDLYKIESGVKRFYRDEKGENLSIYVTILE
ncbi:hypothetical protein O2K51_02485 [Apibacter raozihei]|uniref:hypothetical protein n=1 Tax=Apibacter raozihei TaxID=2500547 RepID=UPI000FE427B7|nr:hypothetical protein [Apibacter raozihei]